MQVATAAVETGATRQLGEESPMLLPPENHVRFPVPPTAFADQGNRQQFCVTTARFGARTVERGGDGRIQVTHQDVHPGAKFLEIGYHANVLGLGESAFTSLSYQTERALSTITFLAHRTSTSSYLND